MAQILLLNPADIRHASYGLAIMNMAYTTYSVTIHAGTIFWTFLLYCLKVCWAACVFTTHVFKYWIGRAHFFYQNQNSAGGGGYYLLHRIGVNLRGVQEKKMSPIGC